VCYGFQSNWWWQIVHGSESEEQFGTEVNGRMKKNWRRMKVVLCDEVEWIVGPMKLEEVKQIFNGKFWASLIRETNKD